MSKTGNKQVVKILQARDIEILTGLYEHRALSTEQIMRRYEMTKWYTYKKLTLLRNSRLISTHPIRGYLANQKRQGNYHRISETGITCLRKQGVVVERSADQLRVNIRHLPFLLSSNDIMIDLEKYQWAMKDSRQVKVAYGLNRGANVQGMLTSPREVGYLFYMFMHGISKMNLNKTAKEIKESNYPNYMVFAKSQNSFTTIVNVFSADDGLIVKCESLKIFPFVFAKYYLRLFEDENNVMKFLEDYEIYDLSFKTSSVSGMKQHDGLKRVVRHNGEEKYLVNLLDTDLVKVYNIKQYRKEMYELDGRKVLVVTTSNTRALHEQLLASIHHVDYLEIDTGDLVDYLSAI